MTSLRNAAPEIARSDTDSTTDERYELRRLCPCGTCEGTGKARGEYHQSGFPLRCPECRGEGRILQLVATCPTPEAVGVALVSLSREGEWEGCQFGLLDSEGEVGLKWLIMPYPSTARTVTEAARTLRAVQTKGEK